MLVAAGCAVTQEAKGPVAGTITTPSAATPGGSLAVPDIIAPANTGCPAPDGSSPHYTRFTAAPPTCIVAGKAYKATVQTDAGSLVVTLNASATPRSVNNFVFLAGYHFFDGTAFHRVVKDFVDQGGDPTGTGSGGPGYQFADELPKAGSYKAGSLAMANSGPNTNGSQFFLVVSDQAGTQLTPNYSLFGQVAAGMDVVQKINEDGNTDALGTPKVVHRIVAVTISSG